MEEIWQCRPLHIPRNAPTHYERLISQTGLSELISLVSRSVEERATLAPELQIIGGQLSAGAVRLRNNVIDAQELHAAYKTGSSILIQSAHRYWIPFQKLCDDLADSFLSPVNTTLIRTPPGSQAFGRHFDVVDSLILQLDGEKNWRLLNSGAVSPLENIPLLPFETSAEMVHRLRSMNERTSNTNSNPIELTLRAGDFLYVPRGMEHDVWTTSTDSTHLTIAIQPVTYSDAIVAGLRNFIQQDRGVRQRLGLENASLQPSIERTLAEIVARFSLSFDTQSAIDSLKIAANVNRRKYRDLLAGDIESLEPVVSLDSVFEHVSSVRGIVSYEGDSVCLAFGDRRFLLPRRTEEALAVIATGIRFELRDLPGISDKDRLVLCKRLLRAHVLKTYHS